MKQTEEALSISKDNLLPRLTEDRALRRRGSVIDTKISEKESIKKSTDLFKVLILTSLVLIILNIVFVFIVLFY